MPCVWHDGELALGTVAGEKLRREVCVVGLSDRHDDVSHPDIQCITERFLKPELLKCNLAATFNLMLELASLLGLNLDGHLVAAVLELDLATHRPAVTEVIPNIDDHVRQVDATVSVGVFVTLRMRVAEHVVAVECAGIHRLSIATNC